MKKHTLWILFSVSFLIFSCSEIAYKEPQPKGKKALSQIPSKLQGRYLIKENDETVDTLVVMSTHYKLGEDEVSYLSDSLVLKYYKGHYFFNYRDEHTWYLRIVKPQKNGDLLYLEMENIPENEEGRKKFIEKLSADIKVIETQVDDETYYIIDPTPKELISLINKGHFKKQTFIKVK